MSYRQAETAGEAALAREYLVLACRPPRVERDAVARLIPIYSPSHLPENLETAYLAYVRTIIPHWDVELTLGYPPLQKTVGKGPATLGSVPYNGQVIATARWIAPTLLLEYVFLEESSKWRPYIGAGANYTTFYDRNSTAAGDAASGGPTKISLTPSVGWAATVGLNYHIANNWHAYASYSFSKVATNLTADTAGVIRTSHISFAPQALVVSVGYSF